MNLFGGNNLGLLGVGLVTGVIGFGGFRYGKSNDSTRHIVYGILLMAYPYVVYQLSYSIGIGVILTLLMFFGSRFGL